MEPATLLAQTFGVPTATISAVRISVVIPVYNEELNVGSCTTACRGCCRIRTSSSSLSMTAALTARSPGCARSPRRNERVRLLRFRRNYGQTAALSGGIDHARGSVIIPMDGDLQNDPADIPRLLAKLAEGYDVVSGWRVARQDPWKRRIPSLIANRLVSWISGVRLHDYGCSLKVYRRRVLEDVRLYGEMHRFVPIYAVWQGARVTELPVTHHPRAAGRSHYGMERTLKVVLDLIVVKFLASYVTKPIYVFGGFGLLSLFLSALAFLLMVYFKYWGGKTSSRRPCRWSWSCSCWSVA